MTGSRATVLLAASALGVSLMSGCGTARWATSTGAAPDPSAANRPALRLAARKIDKLGRVVTDSRGMTLYRFDRDTAGPSASNCDGPCTDLWPPVTATADRVELSGIDKHLVGTVLRKDGSVQLTLKGWPLYRYAEDTAPGDAKGQDVGNTWFAAAPDGKKVLASAGRDDSGYGY